MRGVWLTLAACLLLGCGAREEGNMVQQQAIDWQALAQKRVVFGHQSVGKNVLSGVEQLARRDGVNYSIQEQRGPATQPGISHFKIGQNEDPLSKIDDFRAALDSGAAQGADVALMKLCYIDFNSGTDARQIAERYTASLDALSQKYPATRFVAVTAPLTTVQTGPKAWIKRLMGKLPSEYRENAKRAEFNQILRAHYAAQGQLFDLARIEAAQQHLSVDGREVEALDPALTYDGGHLNERGQTAVAAEMLRFIARLPAAK